MNDACTAEIKSNLTAECWASAALDAISHRGIAGLAVEPIARELGVTKGSFYWHFANREALLRRALDLWEQQETEEVLQRAAREPDPLRRIERAIVGANTSRRASRIYQALASASQHPLIAARVQQVSQRRLQFLMDCYRALGLPEDEAHRWARMAFSILLGTLQLRHDLPDEWPSADTPDKNDYIQLLLQQLIPEHRDTRHSGP